MTHDFCFRLHPGKSAMPEEIKEFCKSHLFSSMVHNCLSAHTMFAQSTPLIRGIPLPLLDCNITLILREYGPL